MKKLLLFAIYLSSLFVWSQSYSKDVTTLRIGSMELPPYGWQDFDRIKHGLIYEMNQEIGIRSGVPFTNEILPFNRMLSMLKKGQLDLVSSQAHNAAMDAGDKLAIQHTINVIGATKKGSGIRSIKDLRNKHLMYHHSASYEQLEGLPKKISRVSSYREMVQLLHAQPFYDAGIFSEPAYYHWMKDLGLTPKDFGNVVMIEAGKKQWIFVRKGLPKKLRKKLAKVVTEIYHEKLYEKLLKKYGKR